ncbi:hypothetical protein MXB_3775 [Myxobolus squamalis]|nr:hypothetical protein MXB_3775 [Myxobolus squamalis]
MSERKVINVGSVYVKLKKYYPPDFDATKLPKLRITKNRQFVIRIMAPMSMRCTNCGEYIYKGKKFNAKQETVNDQDYLGLRIYRFYIKCPSCISEITFKTDPEKADYVMEHGATRSLHASQFRKIKSEKCRDTPDFVMENAHPIQSLEHRIVESQFELDKLEYLENLRDLKNKHLQVDRHSILIKHIIIENNCEKYYTQEEDRLVEEIFGKKTISPNCQNLKQPDYNQGCFRFRRGQVRTNAKNTKTLVKIKQGKKEPTIEYRAKSKHCKYSSTDSDDKFDIVLD